MKTRLLAVLAALAAGCGSEPSGPVAPHPLPEENVKKGPKPPAADNGRCFVCHLNLEEDELVRTHAAGGIGCENCHGMSDDHCGDEGHATAPDVMFPEEKIPEACWHCHPSVKPKAGFQPAVPADAKKGCMECHFNHRLERREFRWDKVTREKIE